VRVRIDVSERVVVGEASAYLRLDRPASPASGGLGQPLGLGDRLIVDGAKMLQQLVALIVGQIGVGMDIGKEAARHIVVDERLGADRFAATVGAGRYIERTRQQAIE
jgi:hypothetical protein